MSQYRDGNIVILLPIEDSPAEEQDLRTGDIIVKINGEECKGEDLSLIANKVKGEEGTTVELEILRGEETLTKTITRRSVEIKDIKSEILENNIGYIRIISFDDGVSEEFEKKIKEFKEQNIKSLIIDIRDNGGGIVSEVIDIADMLIPKDNYIMLTIDRNEKEEITKSQIDSIAEEMNIIVLANENSASASEILAGALQDNNIAKVVGTTTFGKGVMQEVFPLSSIGGALKITIEEFKTANGNVIEKKGIVPNVIVEQPEDETTDIQLQKAIDMFK